MSVNSLESNMLGLQSDCPHRERLQYGGDIVAVSPSAMHFFDLSALVLDLFKGHEHRDFKSHGMQEQKIDPGVDSSCLKVLRLYI